MPRTLPRTALYRNKKVRILYYEGDDYFRILTSDDVARTVHRDALIFTKH